MFKHFFYCCQSNENKDPAIIVDTNNNSNNCQISTNTLNNDNTGKIDDHIIETLKNIENNQLGVNIHDKEDNKNIFSNKLFNSTFENKNKLLLNSENENNDGNINENEKKSEIKNPKQSIDKIKSITFIKNNIPHKKNSVIINRFKDGSRLSLCLYNHKQTNNTLKYSKESLNFTNLQNSSKENPSFVTFSNIVVQYKTNSNNKKSKSNLESDTEVLTTCELILTGDIFPNKELNLDRFGVKNINNIITKNNKKRNCELKFGVKRNNNHNDSSITSNDKKKNFPTDILTKNISMKNDKNNSRLSKHIQNRSKSRNIISTEISNKSQKRANNSIKIRKESKGSFSTLKDKNKEKTQINNSNAKNDLDIILNISQSKLPNQLNGNRNEENIILFSINYNPTLEMFDFYSCQELYPIELLINYNLQLRKNIEYNILLGSVKMKLRVTKNIKKQNVINISIVNGIDINGKKENKNNGNKKDNVYTFNPAEETMPITIGRTNCNINLSNISVSKLHAQINYLNETDEFVICDLKSTNGTYLLLKKPLNYLCINRDFNLRVFESNFSIRFVNFDS